MATKINLTPYVSTAQKLEKEKGIPTSITLAQLILESSSSTSSNGLSKLATQANNLFGIKATSKWDGDTYQTLTNEEVDGKMIPTVAIFKKYATVEDSINDYGNLLSSSRYTEYTAGKVDFYGYATGLVNAGYATDSNYVSKLVNIASDNNLSQYSINNTDSSMSEIEQDIANGMTSDELSQKYEGGGVIESPLIPTVNSVTKSIVTVVVIMLVIALMVLFFFNTFKMEGVTSNE